MRILTVAKNDAGQRLDKFLTKAVKNLPVSLMYKSIRTKKIKVNRKRAELSQMLNEGDTVQLFLAEDVFGDTEDDKSVSFEHITPIFKIVYEDENILVVNKPSGLSSHEDETNDKNNLLVQIQAYLYKKGEYNPENEQTFAPSLCNRIDRNTEGLVIAAKNAAALREMDRLIKERRIDKKYLCLAHGCFAQRCDVLEGWHRKDSSTNTVRVSDKYFSGAKEIKTEYKVIDEKNEVSLVEVTLHTGRTHQIRAHLAYIGHPLVGDGKYGINKEDRKNGYSSQALCSYYIKITGAQNGLEYLNGKIIKIKPEEISFAEDFYR